MWAALGVGYWLCLLLAIPAAGLLLRLFMIQHDCGHGAFFRNRFANDWVGRVIGVLTLTPYDFWRSTHAIHHSTSGNLDRRGTGDIDTLTVREYLARSRWGRLRYRAYRHPLVMFGVGPGLSCSFIQHRLPVGLMRQRLVAAGSARWRPTSPSRSSSAAMIWLVGVGPFLLVHLPITLLAASVEVTKLFYVQHQFENAIWTREDAWNQHEVALHGSSCTRPAAWCCAWFYRQYRPCTTSIICAAAIPTTGCHWCCGDHPDLGGIGRLTLGQSLGCIRLALWDENQQRLVSFNDLRRHHAVVNCWGKWGGGCGAVSAFRQGECERRAALAGKGQESLS